MTPNLPGLEVLFIAGFGPIVPEREASRALYVDTLRLPLKPLGDSPDYLTTEVLDGVKHFALWPLAHASQSCFGVDQWPANIAVPQSWLEFEVQDMAVASSVLKQAGYTLLVDNRQEPWGQWVTRFLSPEGILLGVTHTPWLRD